MQFAWLLEVTMGKMIIGATVELSSVHKKPLNQWRVFFISILGELRYVLFIAQFIVINL